MKVIETTLADVDTHLQGETPVLLDMWAPWCGPCRKLAPHLDILVEQFAGKIKVLKLNVDEDEKIYERFALRSIPSLIFYAKGKEQGRLVGTSALRLKETVKKWLREAGAALPEDAAGQPESFEPASEPRKWRAFGGDPAVKTAALARLRNEMERGGRDRPSKILAGEHTFEAAMGMPEVLGALLDFVVVFREPDELDKQSARKTDMVRVLSIVEDFPVGGDLGPAVIGAVHDLMYASPWAVPQYFAGRGMTDLIDRLAVLHGRECAGEAVFENERNDLVRQSIERVGTQIDVNESKQLEMLSVPLSDQAIFLVTYMMAIETMRRHFGELSEADKERMHEMESEDEERALAVVGDQRKEPDELWQERYIGERRRLKQVRREEAPGLWARYDEREQRLSKMRNDISIYVLDSLLSRLRLVTP
ncbi:hypothetical protein LGM65_30975 [Burkholderia anthina]|uniref:thioredoxin family protein n=1 Tax=Burkholderia anthina TaxID=179879 RepID=UPI001CF33ED7|nr:thioredoxin domain-containing protein [Burkholderia anthina]MCA8095246.1 hypothetical protein [Burkholderia anthina]